jgi:hypothetical protein
MTWRDMGSVFVRDMYNAVYEAKINGLIPWAGVKRLSLWGGKGDPNPGGAFEVTEEGQLKVLKGYYFFKQVSQAGQARMQVCQTLSNDSDIKVLAFAQGRSNQPDSFVLINSGERKRTVHIHLRGSAHDAFKACRTSESASGDENYRDMGMAAFENGVYVYLCPAKSVTTYIGINR